MALLWKMICNLGILWVFDTLYPAYEMSYIVLFPLSCCILITNLYMRHVARMTWVVSCWHFKEVIYNICSWRSWMYAYKSVCMYTYTNAYICIYIYICACMYKRVCTYVCICIWLHICICIHISIHKYIHIYIYINVHINIYIYMNVYADICTYTYI